jgi:hypothetical protein
LPWGDALRLPVTGRQPAWYSPATGRFDSIGGLPADSAGYQFNRVDGGWAVQANAAGKVACGGCGGIAMPVWFLSDGARSATRVGLANLVAPAAGVGALWLTSYPPGANTAHSAAGRAREVGPTGAVLGKSVTLPAGSSREPTAACCSRRPTRQGEPGATGSGTRLRGRSPARSAR